RSLIRRLAANGDLQVGPVVGAPTDHPILIDAPLLLLRRRSVGVSGASERALRALEGGADVPSVLWRIVGLDEPVAGPHAEERTLRPDDALLSKPANDEQVDLIRQLE